MVHLSGRIFLKKNHLNSFYLPLGPFDCAIFKAKLIEQIQSYEDVSLWGWKGHNCPEIEYSQKTVNIIFMYPLAPFIVQNFRKIFVNNQEFWAQNGAFASKNFFGNKINIILMYLFTPFTAPNFDKIVRGDDSMSFLGTKWPQLPWDFLQKNY